MSARPDRSPATPAAPAGDRSPATGAPASPGRASPRPFDFVLPRELEAGEPPEARGVPRDEVRMLVARSDDGSLTHAAFRDLPDFLEEGDVVVLNVSKTIPAALEATRAGGERARLHLSSRLPDGRWVVELRRPDGYGSLPLLDAAAGERLSLPAGGAAEILAPHTPPGLRLWDARLSLPAAVDAYLAAHGAPIRYRYAREPWPLDAYQTVYGVEPGSAEMPSAGRPFTHETITRLVTKGVDVVPLVLHTGVSSLESGESPYEEYYRVPAATARRVNAARDEGARVIAVGTTVVRALESAGVGEGRVRAGEGWTGLFVSKEICPCTADGILTGWHEPESTHLQLLGTVAGPELLAASYGEALRARYRWHEFGDVHLVLPPRADPRHAH